MVRNSRATHRLAFAAALLLLGAACAKGHKTSIYAHDTTSAPPTSTPASAVTPTAPSSTSTSTTASSGAIKLAIASPTPGTDVKGNVVRLSLTVSGIQIVAANGDTSGKTGHFHVFVDRDPPAAGAVIPKEKGIIHSASNPVVVPGLTLGSHRLVVVLGDGAHHRIGSVEAQTTVNVLGPTLTATAPAAVPRGQSVTVNVTVQGVTLVAANGDTSGKTGHLHLFLDRDPTPAGQPIPQGDPSIFHTANPTIQVSDLAPGEHTIWVVLGDGNHVPFDPPVEDKLTLTVT
jgi:hypothetical protein